MIQSAQVASKFTLFTHHAKTFPNLVTALRNSMLRTGVFKDEQTAAEQVVQVLNFNIHLVKDFRGRRYIERITECIPVEEKNEYTFDHRKEKTLEGITECIPVEEKNEYTFDHRKEKTLEGKFDKFFDNATVYFTKQTNRELYKYRNVLEFVDDSYVLTNPISDENIKGMRENMNDADVEAFDAFLERNWGIKPPKLAVYDEEGKEIKSEGPDDLRTDKVAEVSATPAEAAVRRVPKNPNAAGMQRPVMKKRPSNMARPSGTQQIKRKPTELKNFDLDEE